MVGYGMSMLLTVFSLAFGVW